MITSEVVTDTLPCISSTPGPMNVINELGTTSTDDPTAVIFATESLVVWIESPGEDSAIISGLLAPFTCYFTTLCNTALAALGILSPPNAAQGK